MTGGSGSRASFLGLLAREKRVPSGGNRNAIGLGFARNVVQLWDHHPSRE